MKNNALLFFTLISISEDDPWDYGIFGGHNAWDYAYAGTFLLD
jgi:hypothetical protein